MSITDQPWWKVLLMPFVSWCNTSNLKDAKNPLLFCCKKIKPSYLQPIYTSQRGNWDLILHSQLPAMCLNFCSPSPLRNPDLFSLFVLTRQKAAQLPSCLQNRDEMHWKISSQPRSWKKKKRNRKLVRGINSDVMNSFNYYFIEISL